MNILFRDVAAHEHETVLRLLLADEPADRYEVAEKGLLDALKGSIDKAFHRVMVRDDRIIGAVVGRDIGGDAAIILGARIIESIEEWTEQVQRLWKHLEAYLHRERIRFVQWMRSPDGQPPLGAQWGFHQMAILDYFSIASDVLFSHAHAQTKLLPSDSLCGQVRLRPATAKPAHELKAIIRDTYVDSLDCPAFSRYRSVDEVIESYRTAAGYRPDYWRYIESPHGECLGVLLMSFHQDVGIAEVTYMGIVPEARGNGLGWRLLQEAGGIGLHAGAEQVVLAVDRENHPAVRLYTAVGMRSFFSEAVWVRSCSA